MASAFACQGLKSNSLVAGKTTAIRCQLNGLQAAKVNEVRLKILRADGIILRRSWRKKDYRLAGVGTAKETIVVLVPGRQVPHIGRYYLDLELISSSSAVLARSALQIDLLPTKDIRLSVHRIWSGTGPAEKPGEEAAARAALQRLSALYPVRDGVAGLDGDRSAGIRFIFDTNPQGPPNQDGNIDNILDNFKNPGPGKDGLDVAILYRFQDTGEAAGARKRDKYDGWLPSAGIVWNGDLSQVFCHETAHNLDCVNSANPDFDPGGQASHTKTEFISADDVRAGFDIQFEAEFPAQVFDIMFPTGPSPGRPANEISLNSYDWEFIRQKLLQSDSTGPSQPLLQWEKLGGTNLRPHISAVLNLDGRQECFALGGDGSLYHIYESSPGGGWGGWKSMAGNGLVGPVRAVRDGRGSLQVFVVGGDGKLYTRAQNGPGAGFGSWYSLNGAGIRDFDVCQQKNGQLAVMATFQSREAFVNLQSVVTDKWSNWAPLGGHDLGGPVAACQNQDGRLEIFAVGGDGGVYHRWEGAPGGDWSAWAMLADPKVVQISDIQAIRLASGRIFLLLMKKNRSTEYTAQMTPNGGWAPIRGLHGHNLQFPAYISATADGRAELFAIGGNGRLYGRWQVNDEIVPSWSAWLGLGGASLQAGVTALRDSDDNVSLFVLGGNGALYRGFRGA